MPRTTELHAEQPFARLGHSSPNTLGNSAPPRRAHVDAPVSDYSLTLRTLIEDFGGEATSTDLCRRLAATTLLSQHCSYPDFTDSLGLVLDELQWRGAVALEVINDTDCIARIKREGIKIAYNGVTPWNGASSI